uniref:PDEase domain-containing protein n=1 Tax=Echinostoma caproni TaxID=27848 RepID=A0A183AN01_9TREM
LIQDPEFDIFTGLDKDQYKEFRQLVIDMVLCTDMSLHFQQIKNMKSMIAMPEKNTVVVPQSQIGFIDFIVEPSFQVLGDMIERIVSPKTNPADGSPEDETKADAKVPEKSEPPNVPRPWVNCFKENKEAWATLASETKPRS